MSVAEFKQPVEQLSAEERLELTDHLRFLARHGHPEWRKEVGRRLDKCLQGGGYTSDELHQAHARLFAEGR